VTGRLRTDMARRVMTAAVAVSLLVAVLASAAFATTATGTQNPQFRVRVSVNPTHPTVGQLVAARFRIRNLTDRTLRGEWQFTWSTPTGGIGAAVAGPLAPGRVAGETLYRRVTATTPDGRFVLYAEVSDRRGSSHARAHAIVG
jgi:uncharacterized protein (DUF58 family)